MITMRKMYRGTAAKLSLSVYGGVYGSKNSLE